MRYARHWIAVHVYAHSVSITIMRTSLHHCYAHAVKTTCIQRNKYKILVRVFQYNNSQRSVCDIDGLVFLLLLSLATFSAQKWRKVSPDVDENIKAAIVIYANNYVFDTELCNWLVKRFDSCANRTL